jgi:hypothetical protein
MKFWLSSLKFEPELVCQVKYNVDMKCLEEEKNHILPQVPVRQLSSLLLPCFL